MADKPLNDQEIIDLLSKLREETPEYPSKLKDLRKSSFLERIAEFKDSVDDQDGKGKSGGGDNSQISMSTGGGLSGGTATSGISTKSALVIGFVVVLLTITYFFRDQIVEYLAENDIINVEETASPGLIPPVVQPTETPTAFVSFRSNEPTLSITDQVSTPSSGLAATPGGLGNGNDNQDSVPVAGGAGEPTQTTLPSQFSQPTVTPTPSSPDNSIYGRLRYIMCILQRGGESCP